MGVLKLEGYPEREIGLFPTVCVSDLLPVAHFVGAYTLIPGSLLSAILCK